MWQIWLIIAGICLVAEIITVGFLIFWFSIGALIAMVVSFFTTNIIIQTTVFIISSTILIFATKPFVKKFSKDEDTVKTNVYSIIGKTGIVTQEIDSVHSKGQIKVDGEVWSATSNEDLIIPENSEVEILEVKGVKVIVAPTKIASKNIK